MSHICNFMQISTVRIAQMQSSKTKHFRTYPRGEKRQIASSGIGKMVDRMRRGYPPAARDLHRHSCYCCCCRWCRNCGNDSRRQNSERKRETQLSTGTDAAAAESLITRCGVVAVAAALSLIRSNW